MVTAVPTKGLLGPATQVGPKGTTVTSRGGKINPAQVKTNGQLHGVGGSSACASTSANPAPSNLSAMSGAILCLLNAQRANAGLPALHPNGKLGKAARRMAVMMVRQRFFAHVTPSGKDVIDRIRPTGYVKGRWQLGENLAWGSGPLATPASIVNGWMHSPGHRANILHGAFRDIGIGVRLGAPAPGLSGGATYVTDFGRHS